MDGPRSRLSIAVAAVLMQMALGAVYAWSVFRNPLATRFGWSNAEVTLTFTITILVLGFSAFPGGLWMNRRGPRIVAITGGVLYGMGVFLASFADHRLWWLYISYGLMGGIGLGFGYIVPVAVLVKWFPDRRGLITGVAVGGFGAGALVTAPIATRLIESVGVLRTFAYLGVAYATQALSAPKTPMWLGTWSSNRPMPSAFADAAKRSKAARPPSSGLICAWSTTS